MALSVTRCVGDNECYITVLDGDAMRVCFGKVDAVEELRLIGEAKTKAEVQALAQRDYDANRSGPSDCQNSRGLTILAGQAFQKL